MPLFDLNGGYIRNGRVAVSIRWSEPIHSVTYCEPYLIGLAATRVEIRSPDPITNIQSFDVRQKTLSICNLSNNERKDFPIPVFFTTTSAISLLRPIPVREQIDHLLKNSDFGMANRLGDMIYGDNGRAVRIKIKCECALAHHNKLEFAKSLELFAECNTGKFLIPDPQNFIQEF